MKIVFIYIANWLGMVVLDHYVLRHPWDTLCHDYNLFRGRIWVLALIWILVAPYIGYRLRG